MVKSTEFPAVEGVGFTTQPAGAGVEEAREGGNPVDRETDCAVIYIYPPPPVHICCLTLPSYSSQSWRSQEYMLVCVLYCNIRASKALCFLHRTACSQRFAHFFVRGVDGKSGSGSPPSAWPFCCDGEPARHKNYPPPRGRSVFTLFGRDL